PALTRNGGTYKFCSINCNPVASDPTMSGCPGGAACQAYSNGLAAEADVQLDCGVAGTGKNGDSCMQLSDCDAGFSCAGSSAANLHCRQLCSNPGAACTMAGYKCVALQYGSPRKNSTRFGICCSAGICS